MREIKFRAWDKGSEYDSEAVAKMIHGVESLYDGSVEGLGGHGSFGQLLDNEQFVVMQFTGLLDRNGVEVYFGDILATSNDNPIYDLWDEKDLGYTIVKEDSFQLGVSYSNWFMEDNNGDNVYDKKFVEVIGNIYQNPELLR